jgi:hypothetical protein
MSANSDTAAPARTYYPGPGIVVTSVHIDTWETRYRVRDLIIEDPQYFYSYPARVVALYCGLVELFLAGVVAALYGSAPVLLCVAGAVAAAGLVGAIWLDDRRNPRRMELTAWHEGRHIVLFTSDNRRVFEQVRRAVVRAEEANRPALS